MAYTLYTFTLINRHAFLPEYNVFSQMYRKGLHFGRPRSNYKTFKNVFCKFIKPFIKPKFIKTS